MGPNKKQKKIIYFDWDGTLYSKQVSENANFLRTNLIEKSVKKEEIIKLQQNNFNDHYKYVQNLIKENLNIDNILEVKQIQAVLYGFFYNKIVSENPRKYCLIDFEKLKKFKQENDFEFVIVTSLWSGTFRGAFNLLNLNNLFDRIYSVDVNLNGTKQEFIKKDILKNKNSIPKIMVGDREDDILAGKNNNLKTIFCNFGHGNSKIANITINQPNKLFDAILKLI